MGKKSKINLVGFEDGVFSQNQLDEVRAHAQELQEWVERFKIAPDSVDLEEAEEFEEENPGQVFTLAAVHAMTGEGVSVRYGLVPGLDSDEEEFFLAEEQASGVGYPYTILDLFCSVCDGAESFGANCDNCLDGQLSVDLYWDENWIVTAEYSRPE